MPRGAKGAKPAKAKVEATLPVARKSRKNEGSRDHQLEKRLAEALKREAEALEQQTATAEMLYVISSSPTDVQPVFDTIVKNVVRLCDAVYSTVFRVDEGRIDLVAHHNIPPEGLEELRRRYPAPLSVTTGSAQAARERVVVQISDVENDPTVTEDRRRLARIVGYRSQAWVPMLKGDRTLGVIGVSRREAEPFPAQHIALLQTFAAQAVIAIENVRLFKELEVRNREVTEALEQQTATGHILGAISTSPTDIQPIFDIMCRNAVRLCEAVFSTVVEVSDQKLSLRTWHGFEGAELDAMKAGFPMPLDGPGPSAEAIRRGAMFQVPDTDLSSYRTFARERGYRSVVAVPVFREGKAIAAIAVGRAEPGSFSDRQIALLKTFADQAVIAIENVRLFKELRVRTAELTRSVEQLTALGEVGRAVSSTLDIDTVLDTIVARAVQLSGTSGGVIYEYDEATRAFELSEPSNRGRAGGCVAGGPDPTREGRDRPGGTSADPDRNRRHSRGSAVSVRMGAIHPEAARLPIHLEHPAAARAADTGRTDRVEAGAWELPGGDGAPPPDLRHPVGPRDPERSALPRDRGQEPAARGGEPPQVRVPRQHVPRAAHPPERHHRLLGGAGRADVWGGEREAGRVPARHSVLGPAPSLPDQRHPRPVQGGGRAARAGAGSVPSAHRPGQRPDPGAGAGDPARDHAHPDRGRATPADGVITIAVSDTGIGIAPEDQAAIFEEFRQVGREDARKQEGTGLGLTLAKKFVELHGGRIWVRSQVGQGSTFTFTLPAGEDRSSSDQEGGAPPGP